MQCLLYAIPFFSRRTFLSPVAYPNQREVLQLGGVKCGAWFFPSWSPTLRGGKTRRPFLLVTYFIFFFSNTYFSHLQHYSVTLYSTTAQVHSTVVVIRPRFVHVGVCVVVDINILIRSNIHYCLLVQRTPQRHHICICCNLPIPVIGSRRKIYCSWRHYRFLGFWVQR